jgi:hypothetical protein
MNLVMYIFYTSPSNLKFIPNASNAVLTGHSLFTFLHYSEVAVNVDTPV